MPTLFTPPPLPSATKSPLGRRELSSLPYGKAIWVKDKATGAPGLLETADPSLESIIFATDPRASISLAYNPCYQVTTLSRELQQKIAASLAARQERRLNLDGLTFTTELVSEGSATQRFDKIA